MGRDRVRSETRVSLSSSLSRSHCPRMAAYICTCICLRHIETPCIHILLKASTEGEASSPAHPHQFISNRSLHTRAALYSISRTIAIILYTRVDGVL